jgi:polyribonucleotide nucleotidyltransferase
MAEATTVSRQIDGTDKTLSFETGKLAGQAGGSVVVRMGDTFVLVTATGAKKARDNADFFPLTVDIEERMYAAGKIPGSFFRREARAGDNAILTCRLTDRPLRPNFPDGYRNEVHVVGTVMGADQENPYDVLVINAASLALCMSDIPFQFPIGAVRVAYTQDGEWVPFSTYQEGDDSTFEMVVAGRLLDDGDVAVMMVEAGGTENSWDYYEAGAPKVDEAALSAGLDASKAHIKAAIELQQEMLDQVGSKPDLEFVPVVEYSDEIFAAVDKAGRDRIAESQTIAIKADRGEAEAEVLSALIDELADQFDDDNAGRQIKAAIRSITKQVVRDRIVAEGARIDGRGTSDLRSVSSEVQVLPTAHGSGLFQRGETQVMNITTLGTGRMDQRIDGIDPLETKRYMHHYNFPPYSTGETGFMRGPKRREIGHGLLAERALVPVIPKIDEFPYTIRLVSDVLSSNGSTSMGSVCSSSLSLMDAGVPIKAAVAGIAMGLVYADGKYVTLTDILGAEDAMGDMDFKVAGTSEFVTALQLDTKIDGIPADVLTAALAQAKDARTEILEVMNEAISEPRDDVGDTAPKIVSFEIPAEKIGEVIGPKGKVINNIQSDTGAEISVDDDGEVGVVTLAAVDRDAVSEAERQINLILHPPTADVGAVYEGRVVNITKFGAFVNILPGRDGLIHISKLGGSRRIDRVEDVVDLGDAISVRVDDVDPNGKISLTPIGDDDDTSDGGGSDDAEEAPAEERPARSSSDRGDKSRGSGRSRSRSRSSDDESSEKPSEKSSEKSSDESSEEKDEPVADDSDGDRDYVSFEDEWNKEASTAFGELGPEDEKPQRRRRRRR